MRLYGLTGGIGSGKSEAARRFEALGLPVIDADRIAHALLEPGGAAEAAVREAFGAAIVTGDRIDREKLAARVFEDDAARRRLNAIVHPGVGQAVAQRCAALDAEGRETAIVEAALLAEDGARDPWLTGLILVLCPETVRIERLTRRRGMDEAQARARMQAQTPPELKRPAADWIIENDGPIEALHAQVDAIAAQLRTNEDAETP